MHLYRLAVESHGDPSVLAEAQRVQGIIARADFTIAKASIAGTKYLLQKMYGYGGTTRKPLPPTDPVAGETLWAHPHTRAAVQLEREVTGKAQS